MATKNRELITGVFIKRIWTDKTDIKNELFSMGVHKRQLIDQLEALVENEKGMINFTFGAQKADRDKFYMWINDFVPQKQSGGSNYKKPADKPSSPPVEDPASPPAEDDDLPF